MLLWLHKKKKAQTFVWAFQLKFCFTISSLYFDTQNPFLEFVSH